MPDPALRHAAEDELCSWADQGRCKGLDPDMFFPTRGADGATIAAAKAVCAECPVRSECLAWALRHEKFGIWGGTSEKERRALRRQLGIRVDNLARDERHDACGTDGGYQHHIRAGVSTCMACRAAHARASAGRKRMAHGRVNLPEVLDAEVGAGWR
ncbi:MAG: WhiB family transcriptional regulator [Acidimicrobiales bacterium]